MREALGETIREIRKRRRLSREEVAERLACSPDTVGRWERGRHFPDDQTILRLPAALEVSPDEFRRVLETRLRLLFATEPPGRRGRPTGTARDRAAYPPVTSPPSDLAGQSDDEWVPALTYFRRSDLLR
jgi:transcriptional regulator with XRE-family HTH domain